jgi:hypothetical protein
MTRITRFGEFVSERMGVLSTVMDQARSFHETIKADRSRFLFHFEFISGGMPRPIRVKVDPTFKMGGQFEYEDDPPTIVVRKRDDFEVLVHELKHADRYFRMGQRAYEEDYSVMYSISDLMKSNSLLPYKYRNLFFLFYFLQREEFEAYFHSDWVKFSEIVEQEKPATKEEVMRLWRDSTKTLAWQLYSGNLPTGSLVGGSTGKLKMKVPTQQRPFKFSNWCGDSVIDSVIWAYMRHKKDIAVEDGILMKVIKAITPDSIASGLDVYSKPPAKYADVVARARVKLESQIERTMEDYTRKYARIPTMAVSSLPKKVKPAP